jgi:alkylation response protein AidB-like acyl-CoA dehydrogenase
MNQITRATLTASEQTSRNTLRSDLLGRAQALAPFLESRAQATEAAGTLPPEVVGALREAELFWTLLPREAGGLGGDMLTGLEVLEEITRADGSIGWSLMANMTGTALAGAFAGEEALEAMFGGGRRSITAGMLGPGGKSVEVAGGLHGGGKYSFGSGCGHADWFGAGMLVMEDGKPRTMPNGLPEVRVCFLPKDKVRIDGNWDVMGLKGTGSYDYTVPAQDIPWSFTMERTCIEPQRGGPLFTAGIAGYGCLGHAAVALGLMKRSLQEIVRITADKKRPAYPTVVGEHPVFRREFSRNEAAYQSVRAFVFGVFADAQDTVLSGGTLSPVQRARFRQATTHLHDVAADVVKFCYTWAGSAAQPTTSVIGRCMRDMGVATQHVFVDPVSMADAAPPIMAEWAAA